MQVIDSINDVFRFNMSQDVGDVDYNDIAALQREESRECYINTARKMPGMTTNPNFTVSEN